MVLVDKKKKEEEEKRRRGEGEQKSLQPSTRTSIRKEGHNSQLSPKSRGFTLLEVLVAMVIFGILTIALSAALSGSLRSHVLAEQRQDDSENVRGLFAILGRDLQCAYGSKNDPNSMFIAGGSGQNSAGNALLMLSTQTHRITTSDANVDPAAGQSGTNGSPSLGTVNGAQGGNDAPQQPTEFVRYDLDPQSGTLSRLTQTIPNLQTLQSATPGPENVIAGSIVSLTLQYWDPYKQNWQDSWDFEQPNLPDPATAAQTMGFPQTTGTTGSSGTAASATGANGTTTGTGNSDVGLPSAVQITLVLRRKNGSPGNYSMILPIVAHTLEDYPYAGGQQSDPNAPQPAAATGQ